MPESGPGSACRLRPCAGFPATRTPASGATRPLASATPASPLPTAGCPAPARLARAGSAPVRGFASPRRPGRPTPGPAPAPPLGYHAPRRLRLGAPPAGLVLNLARRLHSRAASGSPVPPRAQPGPASVAHGASRSPDR
nr:atherin-like [Aegilops tauschii subsp. strangulata]